MVALRQRGHEVSAPTLSGLGERFHLGSHADLRLHVQDLAAHLEMERLSDITLVGWSYGGMVTTEAVAHVRDRLRGLIYLDAFVPENGKAAVDYLSPAARSAWDVFKNTDSPLPPFPVDRLGLTDPEHIEYVAPRLTPHPWRTFYQPADIPSQISPLPTAYIRCTQNLAPHYSATMDRMQRTRGVRVDAIEAGHSCMVTAPRQTVDLLEKYA